jgi:hypothetical protein
MRELQIRPKNQSATQGRAECPDEQKIKFSGAEIAHAGKVTADSLSKIRGIDETGGIPR